MRVRSLDGPVVIDMAETLEPQGGAGEGEVQHLVEHGLGEPPRERVLLARVERAHDQQATDLNGRSGPELRPWRGHRKAGTVQRREYCLPGEGAEGNDRAKVRKDESELGLEPRCAGVALGGRGCVGRWCAPDGG